jgi:hypothetical protein
MLLIQFLFPIKIIELENRLSQVENKLKVMEVEASAKEEGR